MSLADQVPPIDLSQRLAAIEKLIEQTRQCQTSTEQQLERVQALVSKRDAGYEKKLRSELDQLRSRVQQLEGELGNARQHQQALQQRLSEVEMQARYWQQAAGDWKAALEGVIASLSWRITAPVRNFMTRMRGGKPRTAVQRIRPAPLPLTPPQTALPQREAEPNANGPAPCTIPMSATTRSIYNRLTRAIAARTQY